MAAMSGPFNSPADDPSPAPRGRLIGHAGPFFDTDRDATTPADVLDA